MVLLGRLWVFSSVLVRVSVGAQLPVPQWFINILPFKQKGKEIAGSEAGVMISGQSTQSSNSTKYDLSYNKANTIKGLQLFGQDLNWYRLDDGVMGGRSETSNKFLDKESLEFSGTINTNGGGFCSIRAKLADQQYLGSDIIGFRLKIIGDGKTYKFTISDGNRSSSPRGTPSWQADIPTTALMQQTVEIMFTNLKPSFGGRSINRPSSSELTKYTYDATAMREIGVMLSLRRSDGSPNPKETFGEGIFPFSLKILSIEPIYEKTDQ